MFPLTIRDEMYASAEGASEKILGRYCILREVLVPPEVQDVTKVQDQVAFSKPSRPAHMHIRIFARNFPTWTFGVF